MIGPRCSTATRSIIRRSTATRPIIRWSTTSHFQRPLKTTPNFHHQSNDIENVTFERLLRFGRLPLSPSMLIESAELTRVEMCHGLQQRVNAHLGLPYQLASNPHIKQIISIYNTSLESISAVPAIRTIKDNLALISTLEAIVDDAGDVIRMFAAGFQESRRYLSDEQIGAFLDQAIQGRLSLRLIAEQHLALSRDSNASPCSTRIGIVDCQLGLKQSAESVLAFVSELCEEIYGVAPEWTLSGDLDAKVCFVGIHLQYILTEVLKNAFRATVEHHWSLGKTSALPPVELTFAIQRPGSPQATHSPPFGARALPHPVMSISVRDHGGGIPPAALPHIFSYAFTSVGREELDQGPSPLADLDRLSHGGPDSLQSGLGRIAGVGFGLPMARLYCRYFGGDLEVVNKYGLGGGVVSYLTVGLGK